MPNQSMNPPQMFLNADETFKEKTRKINRIETNEKEYNQIKFKENIHS